MAAVECITIPFSFTALNEYVAAERSHRNKAAKIKKAETEAVAIAAKGHIVLGLPADFVFTWHVKPNKGRYKDPDNIGFACKFIFDGLVMAGVIPNDTRKAVRSIKHVFVWDADYDKVEIRA